MWQSLHDNHDVNDQGMCSGLQEPYCCCVCALCLLPPLTQEEVGCIWIMSRRSFKRSLGNQGDQWQESPQD